MKKHEVLSLLQRFPELVDSDDLATDLLSQACDEPGEETQKATVETERPGWREPAEPAPGRPR